MEQLILNTYHPDQVDVMRKHYREEEPTTWPFYVIQIPLLNGNGPASFAECDEVVFEVWDKMCNSHFTTKYLPKAIKHAMLLNKVIFHATTD